MTKTGLTLGALGGPQTFNAQAAQLILARYPEFGEIIYYPTSDEAMAAALRGEVDATCGQEQTSKTGFHAGMQARISKPGSTLYVVAETSQRYHCSLLGKPGATLAQVRHVLGHDGSIGHSRRWLETNLPGAKIEIVTTNSLGAARAVLDGDGSIASVGSSDLAREFALNELVREIDDGSVVNYWAVSLDPRFSPSPTRVVVAGRFGDDTRMSGLIRTLADTGFVLQAVFPRASGRSLYEYDYVLRFRGTGRLDAIQTALTPFNSVRLAGAWDARD